MSPASFHRNIIAAQLQSVEYDTVKPKERQIVFLRVHVSSSRGEGKQKRRDTCMVHTRKKCLFPRQARNQPVPEIYARRCLFTCEMVQKSGGGHTR